MHVILDTGKAKLWRGGARACLDTNLLLDNHIQAVWPVAKCAMLTDTAAVRVLPLLDGAGVTRNQPPLHAVLDQVVCWFNGARRSATLTTLAVMRLTGEPGPEAGSYVSKLRNIVDLRPPRPGRHRNVRKPIEFLRMAICAVGDTVGQQQEV